MFEGEKTFIFWVGLIILGLASVVLFWISWSFAVAVWDGYTGIVYRSLVRSFAPFLFGGVVFLLVGLYMMKSGKRRREERRVAEERPVAGIVYCSNCGTRNVEDAVYCKKCGEKTLYRLTTIERSS